MGQPFAGFEFKSVALDWEEGKALGPALDDFMMAEKLPPYLKFSPDTQPIIFGSGIEKQVWLGSLSRTLCVALHCRIARLHSGTHANPLPHW